MPLKIVSIISILVLTVGVIALLSACGKNQSEAREDETYESFVVSTTHTPEAETSAPVHNVYDNTQNYDAYVVLSDEKTTVNGVGASFEVNTLNITSGGTYYITGNLSDGQIYVNSNTDDKKVKLVFASVNVSCSYDAPLFVENSPKETVLILQQGTQNYFSDTERSIPEDTSEYATATIYSKDDLQIEGDGELFVSGNFEKGIFSKNDIDIRGGNINITAKDDGIRGKDSVEIENSSVTIVSGADGIRTNETAEEDKGDILISSGVIDITSTLDGIQATGNVIINRVTSTI